MLKAETITKQQVNKYCEYMMSDELIFSIPLILDPEKYISKLEQMNIVKACMSGVNRQTRVRIRPTVSKTNFMTLFDELLVTAEDMKNSQPMMTKNMRFILYRILLEEQKVTQGTIVRWKLKQK